MKKIDIYAPVVLVFVALSFLFASAPAFSTSCDRLAHLAVPHVTIASASVRDSLKVPDQPDIKLPEFCRVVATASPAQGSHIGIEVWIPVSDWNGRLEGVGNGGYSSRIYHFAMANALRHGYAVVGTDTGHTGDDLKFAMGHPERIDDWGYRSIHVMTRFAKLVVRDLKGRFPDYSYFVGCSTGGGQALSEAQRFPDDYDGILAGDPGNDRVNLNALFLWAYAVDYRVPGQQLTPAKLILLHAAALHACDGDDGVADGIISNPLSCHFDPSVLLCDGSNERHCLTPAEVETAKAIYAGVSHDGKLVYPGFEPGSESMSGSIFPGWSAYLTGLDAPKRVDFWKYWVFNDPAWDWHSFDFGRDVKYANQKLADVNSIDPDLRRFSSHGGKLLLYHGWSDPVVPPRSTIEYVKRVAAFMGSRRASGTVRLFLVPGMGHCVGGYGPLPDGNQWPPQTSHPHREASIGRNRDASRAAVPPSDPSRSFFGALVRWTEEGTAPNKVIGGQRLPAGKVRTRPICVYPRVAKWTGQGSSDNAANFVCVVPPTETQY